MDTVDSHIESLGDEIKPIVIQLRKVVKSVSMDFTEQVKWKAPTYSINKNICSIIAHKHHVNLQIFRGADIETPELLLGTGKVMRHLRFEKLSDVETVAIRNVIKQAVQVDRYS